MNLKYLNLIILFILSFLIGEEEFRIITIGGCVTETVFDLEMGKNVVAVDLSSKFPNQVKDLPQVGYIRAISSEGILSMMPDLILTTTDMGPKNVVKQIKNSGVRVEIFDSPKNLEGIINLIDNISDDLNVQNKGSEIKLKINNSLNKLESIKKEFFKKPSMAFFMSPKANSFNAAGSETRANYLIEFLGGENVFKDGFNKYKKVTKEEILNLNPDIIFIGNIYAGEEESIFSTNDEFKELDAVKNKKILTIDMGKYLTFGPSFVDNAIDLLTQVNVE